MKRTAVAMMIGAILTAGCSVSVGGGNQLDTGKLEDEISNGYESQSGLELTAISCPDDVEIAQGDEFECQGTDADGDDLTFAVTQTDDQGNVDWEVSAVNGQTG